MATTTSTIRPLTPSPGSRKRTDDQVAAVTQGRPPQRQHSPRVLFALPGEPEDARITGGTRSLDRRLLALNLSGSHPGTTAA
jgi:hypothetical protein